MRMKSVILFFEDKNKKFKEVMKKRWLLVVIGVCITFAFLIIRISLAENLVYISDNIYLLGCEMVTEAGPGPMLKDSLERHKQILKDHKNYIEQRISENTRYRIATSIPRLPVVNWLFGDWDEYSAEKGIDKAEKILEDVNDVTDERKIIEAIWLAGEQLLNFREKMISFRRVGRIEVGYYESTSVPKELVDSIVNALNDSHEKLKDFQARESWQKAWTLCEANRKLALLLFLARSRYEGENLEVFEEMLNKSYEAKKTYSETFPEDNKVGKLIALFAQSDKRRLGIVEAMKTNDMSKARYLIWKAKEEVKHNKLAVLDITLKCCKKD